MYRERFREREGLESSGGGDCPPVHPTASRSIVEELDEELDASLVLCNPFEYVKISSHIDIGAYY
ncbi:hypothetical protein ACSBR2_036731 [Camellia fascicularis]